MAIFTVSIFQGGGGSVNVGDGTLLANLSVSAGRGPKGEGFTGGSFNASTGVVTFTSNDGLGFATGDLRGNLSGPSPIGDVTPNTGAFTSLSTTGDTVIGGNLTVNGTTTTVNSQTLDVVDKNITIAFGSVDSAAANGAGLTVNGAGAALTYVADGDKWVFNKPVDVTGNIALTGTVDGRDVSADGSKLDGIEAGATADQTAAEIKTAYESNADTNAFTDAEQSKLAGIQEGAEVNSVDSVNSQTGVVVIDADDIDDGLTTNKFTTASDKTKLDGIEAGADVTDTANVTSAGALMDSEVTNLAAVKSFDPTDYATAAQGTLADSAIQPDDSPTFVNLTVTGVGQFTSTGAVKVPVGTEAQRPDPEATGQFRFNLDTGQFEGYNGTLWGSIGGIVGQVCFFGMTTVPEGFLKANGAAISRTTFAALFAAIGTTYGAGNGSTTFNLPDLRGEFPRGFDDGRGVDSGRAFGSAQVDAFKSHLHAQTGKFTTSTSHSHAAVGGGAAEAPNPSGGLAGGMGDTGNTGDSETRPRNVALLACIKF